MFEQLLAQNQATRRHTDHHRPHYAQYRHARGFAPERKDLSYALVCDRTEGPYVYDLDGNPYIDLCMGFGSILFGHNYPPLRAAIEEQLGQSWSVGPLSPLAGQLAQAITEVAPVERAAFFNSGTEAVMVAVRIAKTVTKRQYFVYFTTAYHGTFDPFLSQERDAGTHVAQASVPGVTQGMLEESYLLDYGTEESLAFIASHGHEIAAVVTEPVQSRRCDFHPREYLHRLRGITEEHGIALIFDEVISGFRIGLGGAQEHFGVRADIVTYGKVVGGGLPIGVVAGKSRFMNALDGGTWQFGDDSRPTTETTFVAGTFCDHPLAMATSLKMLELLRENDGQVLRDLNETTTAFCQRLNAFFRAGGYPMTVANFGSLFRFMTPDKHHPLFYQLLQNGVYIWEGRTCFLSPSHDAEVLPELEARIRRSAEELGAW